MSETTVFSGRLGEMAHITQPNGRIFEQYRRPPGVRLIIVSPEGKILITKEQRFESNSVDLRLPGGKVCDSLAEWQEARASKKDMLELARKTAIKESLEETGLHIENPEFIIKAIDGATVEWDLYYFLVKSYTTSETGQELEYGEDITITWMSPAEIKQAIAQGHMQEWRSVGVLLGLIFPKLAA